MGRRTIINGELFECEEKLKELKYELCVVIDYEVHKLWRTGVSRRRIANQLGTSQATLSKVCCKRTDQLTFNQLFRFLVLLKPSARMLISTY